ncbi:hypothetical protein CNMCM5623_008453 [Aspergillus felis]|uniref:Uncharacterized protein n=1 Tax=Aspergillus felis TaxID=1287682 RepID=A0A8H6V1X5_9EURO|nr:hypothetical protein CNMCM5623_008453 [Aspergillus felis]
MNGDLIRPREFVLPAPESAVKRVLSLVLIDSSHWERVDRRQSKAPTPQDLRGPPPPLRGAGPGPLRFGRWHIQPEPLADDDPSGRAVS